MADGQPHAGDRGKAADPRWPAALALTAAALAVVFAGVRAAVPAPDWRSGPWHQHGVALGAGLEAVLVGLLIASEVRRRRWPEPGLPAAGLRALLRTFLITGAIGIPVLALLDGVGKLTPHPSRPTSPPRQPAPPRTVPRRPAAAHGGGFDVTLILYALLLLVLAAIIVACVLRLRHRTLAADWAGADEITDEEQAEQLRRAVRSGQAALGDVDDARLAIIACYVAMERSLARAGAVRAAAETPDELLARSASTGLVHGAEAAALTGLFYEARFSSHPLPPAKRQEAQRALDVLAISLDAAADPAPTNPAPADPRWRE